MSQFHFFIRKSIHLDSTQTIFMMINNGLVVGSQLMVEAYENLKDDDGFLYVIYTNENVFG